MTERELKKRIQERYDCEISPIDNRNITRVLVDSGVVFFYYYPDLHIAILPPQPADSESGYDLFENMPQGYANPFVAEEDREKFIALYNRIEQGDSTAKAVIRMDDGSVWQRITLNVIERDDMGKAKVVLGIAEDLSDIMNEAVSKQNTLRAANDSLKRVCNAANFASTANHKFLSSLSHDIRTPMNDIIGMAAIAETHIDNPLWVKDFLSKVTSSSRQLLGLINEVLDLSKIATGSFTLVSAEFNFSELVDEVLSDIYLRTEQHHQSLQAFLFNLTHENVIGDRQRLRQLFMCLLSNAVTNTKDGGSISVSISESSTDSPKENRYTIIVSAENPDISSGFDTEASEKSEEELRTDFGLSLASDIVKQMSGSLRAEGSTYTASVVLGDSDSVIHLESMAFASLAGRSVLVAEGNETSRRSAMESITSLGLNCESVATGTEALERIVSGHLRREDYFAVVLCWELEDIDVAEAIRTIRREVGDSLPIIVSSVANRPSIAAQATAAGATSVLVKPFFRSRLIRLFADLLKGRSQADTPVSILDAMQQDEFCGKRALLVEDNEINAEISGEILSMVGLTVEHARDGLRAFQMVQTAPNDYYDIIFMDIQMPVMDGYEATAAIRSLPLDYVRRLPIIAVTANAFAEDVQTARQAGMDEHIAKPLDFTRLHDLLVRYLG